MSFFSTLSGFFSFTSLTKGENKVEDKSISEAYIKWNNLSRPVYKHQDYPDGYDPNAYTDPWNRKSKY